MISNNQAQEAINKIRFFNKSNTDAIRGIAAIIIILGHTIMPGFLHVLFPGYIWVSFFFFVSGYCLQYGINNKPNYNNGFIKKKLLKIYLPYCFAGGIYAVFHHFIVYGLSSFQIILSFLGLKLYNNTLWYVIELIVLYLIFYILSLFKKASVNPFVWISLYMAFIILSAMNDIGTYWYISTLSFVMGICINSIIVILIRILNSKVLSVLCAILFICIYSFEQMLSYSIVNIGWLAPQNYVIVLLQMISVPLFIVFLIIIVQHFNVDYKCFRALSEYSYEIYLYHMLCILCINRIIDIWWINNLLVIIILLIVAYLVHSINNLINSTPKISKDR